VDGKVSWETEKRRRGEEKKMEISWEQKEPGFWLGKANKQTICKISEHWTGSWLDGFGDPIVCGSVEEAKKIAEKRVSCQNEE